MKGPSGPVPWKWWRHSYFGSPADIADCLRALPSELDGTDRVDAVAAEARAQERKAQFRRLRILGATTAESDRIHICRGTGGAPTHSGADSGSDHVITVRRDSDTVAVITLQGITTMSPNFANLNIVVSNNGSSCN